MHKLPPSFATLQADAREVGGMKQFLATVPFFSQLLPETVSYHQLRASACYVGNEGAWELVHCLYTKLGHVYQPPVGPVNPTREEAKCL